MRPAAACAVRRGFSYIRLLPSDENLIRNPYPARLSAHSRFPVLRIHPVWRLHTAHLFTRSHVLPLRKTSYPPTCSARLSARSRFPVLRDTSRPPPAPSAAFRISLFPHFTEHIPSADCTRLSFSPIRIFYPTKNDSSANCFRRVFQHVHFLPFYKEMFHPPSMHSSSFRAFVFSRPAESGSSAARVWRGFPRVRMSCLMGSIPSVSAAPVFPYRARGFVYRDFETRGCMLSRSAAYTIPATLRRFSPRRH